MEGLPRERKTPWDWMGPEERRLLGNVIVDPEEQARWCKAIVFGTLPYMWREKAAVMRDFVYRKAQVRPGADVLVIGECLAECAFIADLESIVGSSGTVRSFDITRDARSAYADGRRGRGGQLATWAWTYTLEAADSSIDSVLVLQGTQHADDWAETGKDILRVLRPGGAVVLAEITLGPSLLAKAQSDLHLSAWLDKVFSRIGWSFEETPYYSPEQVAEVFQDLFARVFTFEWRGLEMIWAIKAESDDAATRSHCELAISGPCETNLMKVL